LALGLAFGLLFPLLGSALVCFEEGCNEGVLYLHQHSRLLQIIDLAPFILGGVFFFLGVNVDRRLKSEKDMQATLIEKAQIQKDLANQLQQQNDELRELNATMDGLVYTASHDLKTPVINFESLLNMLRMVKDQPGQEKMVDEIINRMDAATKRFQLTIGDLLQVSRIEREEEVVSEVIHLKEIVQEIQGALSEFVKENNATILDEMVDDVVFATRAAMTSVFQNLITNAVKYRSNDRDPVLRVTSKVVDGNLQITFADNGSGIDLERQGPKMFKMFTRFHTKSEGTGIGLYIVKRTLVKLGGDIRVESQLEVGTSFIITLPQPH
jgi:signal transduction histidine kinase